MQEEAGEAGDSFGGDCAGVGSGVAGVGGAGGADAGGAIGGREAVREVVALRSASAAVVCAAMLALWIGTTGAISGSGGFLRKGATIA